MDICDRNELDRVFAQYQPDAVMHLAAASHVDRSITGLADFIETNIIGTYILLEAARAYWSCLSEERKKAFRFHHISTDDVNGDLPHSDEVTPGLELPLFTEATAYAPSSPYSESIASIDDLVRVWLRKYGVPTTITNCSNNHGPYHFAQKLIPLVRHITLVVTTKSRILRLFIPSVIGWMRWCLRRTLTLSGLLL